MWIQLSADMAERVLPLLQAGSPKLQELANRIEHYQALQKVPKLREYRLKAGELFGKEGSLEFDADATVSRYSSNGSNGAYVQCWKWVSKQDLATTTRWGWWSSDHTPDR